MVSSDNNIKNYDGLTLNLVFKEILVQYILTKYKNMLLYTMILVQTCW